eukprot:1550885-Pleurochrysis_carterae.AAC.2
MSATYLHSVRAQSGRDTEGGRQSGAEVRKETARTRLEFGDGLRDEQALVGAESLQDCIRKLQSFLQTNRGGHIVSNCVQSWALSWPN